MITVSAEGVMYAAQNDVSRFNREQKTDGYGLLNLRSELNPIDGMIVGFGVENIFDKRHTEHLSGLNRASGNPDVLVGKKVPGTGRNYYATLSYNW